VPSYAVFPERLEVMSQSNLMKVVGRIGGEMVTIEGRLRDSGWALIMPESPQEGTAAPSTSPLTNMMRWVTGFHDAFGLYGRPEMYNWDRSDPKSLFFGYPQPGQRSVDKTTSKRGKR
jgi:CCR4-NOT transcriptional complex subunit CAF120